jgi:hypothetical protein
MIANLAFEVAMNSRRVLLVVVVALIPSAACYRDNLNHCSNAPPPNFDCRDLEPPPDMPMPVACTKDEDCDDTPATPACDLVAKECVQCTSGNKEACTGVAPVCNETTHTCQGCVTHADCPDSDACMPDGSCADKMVVAYVAADGPGTTGMGCEKEAPCPTLKAAIDTPKMIVKFEGTAPVADTNVTQINNKNVVIIADTDARLDVAADNRSVVQISGSSNVEIYDLSIVGSGTTGGLTFHGVEILGGTVKMSRCTVSANAGGLGISVTGGSLELTRSTISNNAAGGLLITNGATFKVVNNFFLDNGSFGSFIGGADIRGVAGSDAFEFNTLAFNRVQSGLGGGINCTGAGFAVRNNIVWRNEIAVGGVQQIFTANCAVTSNVVGPAGTYPAGNIMMDPLFQNELAGMRNLRLQATSPARNESDMTSTVIPTVDFDGEPRPVPTGQKPDIGADEIANP